VGQGWGGGIQENGHLARSPVFALQKESIRQGERKNGNGKKQGEENK
jgi:hypothetical protein